jgi:hypothetical protein
MDPQRCDLPDGIGNGACGACQMVNAVEGLERNARHISAYEAKARRLREVAHQAGGHRVGDHDAVVALEQHAHEVRAEEAGTSSDQYAHYAPRTPIAT